MRTSFPGPFGLRQAAGDLNRQKLHFPLATVRRIGAGLGLRSTGGPDLAQRIEWYFTGKAPVAELQRDPLAAGALLMASALPEDDFEAFLAATALLLLERLAGEGRRDEGFWNWKRLAPHYRLAAPDLRAAIMCGFREARHARRLVLPGGPDAEDCLTVPRDTILTSLGQNRVDYPLIARVERAVRDDIAPAEAGALWSISHAAVSRLPDGPRQAAIAGFRFLYERPHSMEPPDGAEVPLIPGLG
jgi:hypothetical protein